MDQLKRLRTEKGLSQAKLAALADIDPSTVNQIERGAREASPATLRKLAQALDVTLAELLEDASPKDLSPRLPLEERGELEAYLRLVNDQLERFLSGEDPKLVVGGLASAASRLVEWTKLPFEGEAERLTELLLPVLAEADPGSRYWPLERKRLQEGLENLREETPEKSPKA